MTLYGSNTPILISKLTLKLTNNQRLSTKCKQKLRKAAMVEFQASFEKLRSYIYVKSKYVYLTLLLSI